MGSLTLTQYFRRIVQGTVGLFHESPNCVQRDVVRPLVRLSWRARTGDRSKTRTPIAVVARRSIRSMTAPSPMDASWDLMSCVPEGEPSPGPARHLHRVYARHMGRDTRHAWTTPVTRPRFRRDHRVDSPPVCIVNESFAKCFGRTGSVGQTGQTRAASIIRVRGTRSWGLLRIQNQFLDPHDGEEAGMMRFPMSRWLANGGDEMTFVPASARSAARRDGSERCAVAPSARRIPNSRVRRVT